MLRTPLDNARLMVSIVLAITIAGSVTGLTLGRATGAIGTGELWLLWTSLLFAAGLLLWLRWRPFDETPWLIPTACIFYLFYLTAGALLSLEDPEPLASYFVYLLWFFALLGFNRFVNDSRHSRHLSLAITLAPLILCALRALRFPDALQEHAALLVYSLAYLAFAVVLGLYSRYREAYVAERARRHALQIHYQQASEQEAREHQRQRLESLGQLTGGVAHDFNNLLTVILGNTELLEDTLPAGSTERRLASMSRHAAERGAALTAQLLAFARSQPLSPQAVDIPQLVRNQQELLARTLGSGLQLQIETGSALPPASIDPGQLENALLNLCINARDAMPEGGTLKIVIDRQVLNRDNADPDIPLPAGDYLRLSVSDTGLGMSAETRARMFEPFFTTKPRGKGTGLGLAMVHGFVSQSGGAVAVHSAPGQGTTITLLLPAAVN